MSDTFTVAQQVVLFLSIPLAVTLIFVFPVYYTLPYFGRSKREFARAFIEVFRFCFFLSIAITAGIFDTDSQGHPIINWGKSLSISDFLVGFLAIYEMILPLRKIINGIVTPRNVD